MNDHLVDHIKHLRNTHFSLTVVSVILLITASFDQDRSSLQLAVRQAQEIEEAGPQLVRQEEKILTDLANDLPRPESSEFYAARFPALELQIGVIRDFGENRREIQIDHILPESSHTVQIGRFHSFGIPGIERRIPDPDKLTLSDWASYWDDNQNRAIHILEEPYHFAFEPQTTAQIRAGEKRLLFVSDLEAVAINLTVLSEFPYRPANDVEYFFQKFSEGPAGYLIRDVSVTNEFGLEVNFTMVIRVDTTILDDSYPVYAQTDTNLFEQPIFDLTNVKPGEKFFSSGMGHYLQMRNAITKTEPRFDVQLNEGSRWTVSRNMLTKFIIPVITSKREMDVQHKLIEIAEKQWQSGNFKESFHELWSHTQGRESLPIMDLRRELELDLQTMESTAIIAGVEVPRGTINSWALAIIIAFQLYFYLHLKNLLVTYPESRGLKYSWIGLYEDRISRYTFLFTVLVLPFLVAVKSYVMALQARIDRSFMGFDMDFPVYVVLTVLLLVSMLIAYETRRLSRLIIERPQ